MSEQSEKNGGILIRQEQELAKKFISGLELEYYKDSKLVCLTKENAAKIGARILLNPRYEKTVDKTNTESAKHFIEELKKDKSLYKKKTIESIIRRINSENSTRMSRIEMEKIAKKIIKNASTLKEMKDMLKKKDYPLIDIIAKSIKVKTKDKEDKEGKERNRVNFSFATKFCHYMCFYLFEGRIWQDFYSIYDNIVINVLPDYAIFFGTKYALKPFNKSKIEKPSDYYREYQKCIGDILKKNGNKISRNAFDHIMWYYTKTRKDGETEESNNDQTDE
ncbi:MAG: hypothetical protein IKQ16_05795 [Lentisphaeria bacterium]|nr:hypothetical protein [Lentisphaeria bacterium]